MNRTTLVISIVLTALVFTILGGVVYSTNHVRQAQAAAASANPPAANPAGDAGGMALDPQLEQTLLEREAAYQKMIADANARLAEAQKTAAALQAELATNQNSLPVSAALAQVAPEQAAQIAALYLGQVNIYSVESVFYNGATVYQVTFSSGDIALVSLDGQMIGVQRAPRQNSAGGTLARSGGEHENEHEGGHDD
jgi:hypothetical protein